MMTGTEISEAGGRGEDTTVEVGEAGTTGIEEATREEVEETGETIEIAEDTIRAAPAEGAAGETMEVEDDLAVLEGIGTAIDNLPYNRLPNSAALPNDEPASVNIIVNSKCLLDGTATPPS